METQLENIKQLIFSTDAKNHQIAYQILKGNPALAKALSTPALAEKLVQSWSKDKIEIALLLIKNETTTKEYIEQRYLPLIHFLRGKTLNSLRTVPNKTARILKNWNINLALDHWSSKHSFEQHLAKLPVAHAYYALKSLKTIPDFLSQLPSLKKIFISKCQLKGVPDFWATMTQLEDVEIRNNHLQTLPPSFAGLRKVRRLNLSNNRFTELPEVLQHWTQLKHLHIGNKRLTTLPEWIGNLEQLEMLSVSESLIHRLPNSFAKLKKLTYLNVWRTPLERRYGFKSSNNPNEIQAFITNVINNQNQSS